MRRRFRFCWLLMLAAGASAQAVRTAGTVTAVNAQARRIELRTDEGAEANVAVAESAEILAVSSEARSLETARRLALSEIAPGDRVLARGSPATSLLVMSRQELERKRAAERADWQRRGVSGVIVATDAAARTLTVRAQTLAGVRPLLIAVTQNTLLRRYAPDSVKFSDARPCGFQDLQPGDQVRARGEASGDRFLAEEVVSGAFRTLAALVESVDARANTLRVKELDGGRKVAVELRADSRLRRMPEPIARMLSARFQRDAVGPIGPRAPASEAGGAQNAPRREAPAAAGPALETLLERLPSLAIEELKPGDAVVVCGTRGPDPARLAAITLLAGVEPLLESAPRQGRQSWLESWNLDFNMNLGW